MSDPSPSSPGANKWYRDGLRFECTRSGKCCRAHGEYDQGYLDDAETAAIAALREQSVATFEAEMCQRDDAGDRVLVFRDGACPLLDGAACGVYEARPVQCRTWPFWRENLRKKIWDREIATFCPGVGRGPVHSAEEIDAQAAEADGE